MQTIQVNNHKCCGYTKTQWDLIMSTIIARATHTFAATLALRRPQAGIRPGRWSISLNTMQGNSEILWLYESSMGPNYIYSYSKSHAYSRSDFGPVP